MGELLKQIEASIGRPSETRETSLPSLGRTAGADEAFADLLNTCKQPVGRFPASPDQEEMRRREAKGGSRRLLKSARCC